MSGSDIGFYKVNGGMVWATFDEDAPPKLAVVEWYDRVSKQYHEKYVLAQPYKHEVRY